MRRALLALLLLLGPAHARIKVDRYEPDTLPDVKLWVTLLDLNRPVEPNEIRNFSLYVNGQLLSGDDVVEFEAAHERAQPMAIAVVADARYPERWRGMREGLAKVLEAVPEDSIAFGFVTHEGARRLPEEGWTDEPQALPKSMQTINASGDEPRLRRAVREALHGFPLREGLEPEAGEVVPPEGKDAPEVPADRVLFVIGDGAFEHGRGDASASRQVRELVYSARRRGVRVMSVGITGEEIEHLWVLRALARKTGGTYRRANSPDDLPRIIAEAGKELRNRYVLTAEVPDDLRRGDSVNLKVRATLKNGAVEETREYIARLDNVLGWLPALADKISDVWERWPWWARALVYAGVPLLVLAIVLLVLVRKAKKRREAREAEREARAAAMAQRAPCGVCGNMMMPDWPECLFCAQQQGAARPMRFRLTGRAGVWMGQALRFDRDLITLGSGHDCDVQIPDRGVAAQHCGLRDRGGVEFVLTDFNTDGGTWVNGERITQIRLAEGDLLRIGETEFVFGVEA